MLVQALVFTAVIAVGLAWFIGAMMMMLDSLYERDSWIGGGLLVAWLFVVVFGVLWWTSSH